MAYCSRCDRYFVHEQALDQHIRASSAHYVCDDCDKDFSSWTGLQQHYVQSPRHHYCQRCDRHFSTYNGLMNHCDAVHYFCMFHRKHFNSAEGLRQHYIKSGDHYYCTVCDTLLGDEEDFIEHGEEEYGHYLCRDCVMIFDSEDELMDHNDCLHYFCRACNRLFRSAANLQAHLNSNLHAARNFKCPGRACGKSFVSISALILHAESGTCPSGVTRAQVDAFVARKDRRNVITNPNRMIKGPDGSQRPPEETEYWATQRSWNGWAYECFLCAAEFNTLGSLNAHLKSPRHRSLIYRCPQSSCGMQFRVLSALSQHVESGSCGVRKHRQVQNLMDQLTSNFRMIAI